MSDPITYINIDELEELAAPAAGDWLIIYDVSTGTFKKIDAEYYGVAT